MGFSDPATFPKKAASPAATSSSRDTASRCFTVSVRAASSAATRPWTGIPLTCARDNAIAARARASAGSAGRSPS